MKLEEVQKNKTKLVPTSARIRPEYSEYIKKNKINLRLLIEKAIDEIAGKEYKADEVKQ